MQRSLSQELSPGKSQAPGCQPLKTVRRVANAPLIPVSHRNQLPRKRLVMLSITHKLRTILAAFRSGRGKLPPRCLNKSGLNCFKLLERRRRVPRPVGILALSPGNWPIANFMMQG